MSVDFVRFLLSRQPVSSQETSHMYADLLGSVLMAAQLNHVYPDIPKIDKGIVLIQNRASLLYKFSSLSLLPV